MALKPGGRIKISPDITVSDEQGFIAKIKGHIHTLWQRFRRVHKVDKVMESMPVVKVGYTIGPLQHGRYLQPQEGKKYKERSFEVEILDVDHEFLVEVATLLKREFSQQAVVVEDYASGWAFFCLNGGAHRLEKMYSGSTAVWYLLNDGAQSSQDGKGDENVQVDIPSGRQNGGLAL